MRAGGARVGLGELLAAHRALAAVDSGVARRVRSSRCAAALCSTHADLSASRRRSPHASARADAAAADPLSELGEIERPAPPRVGVPIATASAAVETTRRPCPPPGARSSCCARRTSPSTPTPSGRSRGALLARLARRGPTRPGAPHAADRAGAATSPTCARTVRASLRHGGELLERRWREPTAAPAPARAGLRRLGLDVALRADAAPVRARLRGGARARRGVRVRHAADARSPASSRGRDHDRALARAAERGHRLVGRHADRRRARGAQPRARPPDRPRRGRRDPVRRLGPRRPRTARGRRWRACARSAHRLVWLNPLGRPPATTSR